MLHPDSLRLLPRRRRFAVAVVLAAVVVAGVVGCTGDDGGDESADPTAPSLSLPELQADDVSVVTLPEGFVQPDTRGVRIAPVVGRPRGGPPPLPVYGGAASLSGTVVGPDGPVDGATVRVERWVGNRSGSVNVATGGGGRFSARGLLGGRYRVRAWLPPNLTATQSQVAFLAQDGSASMTVELERFEGVRLQASADVAAFNVDDTVRVRALYTQVVVGDDGIVVGEPVGGAAISLTAGAGLALEGGAEATTDGGGLASWPVRCLQEGSHSVSLTAPAATTSYTLPACGPRATTTTTTPEIPAFAVGERFTVPRSAPLPAGTYETDQPNCATSFQMFIDGAWQEQRREIRGPVLGLLAPARDFQAVPGTDGCRYRRTA